MGTIALCKVVLEASRAPARRPAPPTTNLKQPQKLYGAGAVDKNDDQGIVGLQICLAMPGHSRQAEDAGAQFGTAITKGLYTLATGGRRRA